MISFSSCDDAHDHFQVSNLAKIYMKDNQMDEINNIFLLMNYNLDEIETHKWHLSLYEKLATQKTLKDMEETWMSLTNISKQMKLNHIHIQINHMNKRMVLKGFKPIWLSCGSSTQLLAILDLQWMDYGHWWGWWWMDGWMEGSHYLDEIRFETNQRKR